LGICGTIIRRIVENWGLPVARNPRAASPSMAGGATYGPQDALKKHICPKFGPRDTIKSPKTVTYFDNCSNNKT